MSVSSAAAPTPEPHGSVTVDDRVRLLLDAAGAMPDETGRGARLGIVDAADHGVPIEWGLDGVGCGGGRRGVLDGRGIVLLDGVRPTHLLVRAEGVDGPVQVLVEVGTRGVTPWPGDGPTSAEIIFDSARLDSSAVVGGVGGR